MGIVNFEWNSEGFEGDAHFKLRRPGQWPLLDAALFIDNVIWRPAPGGCCCGLGCVFLLLLVGCSLLVQGDVGCFFRPGQRARPDEAAPAEAPRDVRVHPRLQPSAPSHITTGVSVSVQQ